MFDGELKLLEGIRDTCIYWSTRDHESDTPEEKEIGRAKLINNAALISSVIEIVKNYAKLEMIVN